jgi:hypothetical protein
MAAPIILPFTTATFSQPAPGGISHQREKSSPGPGRKRTDARPPRPVIPDANFNSPQVSPLFSWSGANRGDFDRFVPEAGLVSGLFFAACFPTAEG